MRNKAWWVLIDATLWGALTIGCGSGQGGGGPHSSATPGSGWGTTFTLLPGAVWTAIPGQLTPTWVNAATAGHRFSAISW